MKFESLNPWVIIRWTFAAFLYCATVAIAWDQISERQKKIERYEAELKVVAEGVSKIEKSNQRMKAQAEGFIQKTEELQVNVPKMLEEAKTAGRLEVLAENIERLEKQVTGPVQSIRSATGDVGHAVSSAIPQDPPPPAWKLPPAFKAKTVIKAAAQAKWGTRYDMVEYEIKKQTEAYNTLVGYEKQRWQQLMRTMLDSAGNQWGDQYDMVLYEVNKQLEAKQRLDKR